MGSVKAAQGLINGSYPDRQPPRHVWAGPDVEGNLKRILRDVGDPSTVHKYTLATVDLASNVSQELFGSIAFLDKHSDSTASGC